MPHSNSPGVEQKEEIQKKNTYTPSSEEQEHYNFILDRVVSAKSQRDKVREEFDDLCYEDDYLLNKRAMNSYLRPKKNEDEVRIVTATTEKRVETVWNELMSMNFQPEIAAYDHNDNEIEQLGETFEDVVKRTNEIEMDEDRYSDAVMELLSQRAVFVEELFINKKIRGKKVRRCEKRVLSGLQVFLGDISLPAWRFNDQPYLIKYERMLYAEAETIYKEFENFKKHVKPGSYNAYTIGGNNIYRKDTLSNNEVEILHYMDYPNNEYQILIQGVPMFDVGEKLPWEYEGYNITMTVLKPMAIDFAYGKPLTASAKTLQALDNETIRNLIRKFRQAIEPPIGVKSGRVYSRDIWSPGAMTQGIGDKDFSFLINHQGVTPSELQVYELIKTEIGDMVGSVQAFLPKGKKPSNQEMMQAKQMAIKMLGLAVIAVMRLKKNMTFLRIYNVLDNFTKSTHKIVDPVSSKVTEAYARFTIDEAELGGGSIGRKIVQFSGGDMSQKDQFATYAYEQRQKKKGNNVAFKNINVKLLNSIKPNWYVNIISKERDTSELSKAMFRDKIEQGQMVTQITGMPMNPTKVVDAFERTWKERDLFQRDAPAQMASGQQPGQGQPPQGAPMGNQVKQAGIAPPSLNKMLQGNVSR